MIDSWSGDHFVEISPTNIPWVWGGGGMKRPDCQIELHAQYAMVYALRITTTTMIDFLLGPIVVITPLRHERGRKQANHIPPPLRYAPTVFSSPDIPVRYFL